MKHLGIRHMRKGKLQRLFEKACRETVGIDNNKHDRNLYFSGAMDALILCQPNQYTKVNTEMVTHLIKEVESWVNE